MPIKEDLQVFKSKQFIRILFQRKKKCLFFKPLADNNYKHQKHQPLTRSTKQEGKKNCLKVFESISKQGDSGGELTPEIKIKK